jgi:site-specific recombinase XerD
MNQEPAGGGYAVCHAVCIHVVAARLGHLSEDEAGNRWIEVLGKGSQAGKVVVPAKARLALDRYLAAREISTSPTRWPPAAPLLASLKTDGAGLTGARLWAVMKRFFKQAAAALEPVNPALAEKLRRASPHWMRHTHATHALARGAALTTVRDNLRHASISTTSGYLHTDEARRAKEMGAAFGDGAGTQGGPTPKRQTRRSRE